MSKFMKRSLALLLVFITVISLTSAIGLRVSAAEVSYVYDGKYIYNWGTRGEVATFLSPNAESFYEDNNTSYEILSSYQGGTGKSDAPSSQLYRELKELMTDAQSYTTSYSATKELFRYTDCQNSGGKISSFYSGKQIGPAWGEGSWNREHTWPNSKGLGGSDEDDIMMLRPTSTSENSSRGNTAYGKSSGYYNPNKESGGEYDLRGDVARIFLYVYVRWGNKNYAWGSSGVMESVEVLLEWMEADPVDTWELGRNDSVESITGTRNVFVDYPELAFILFGEEIPEDMSTPSGEGDGDCGHNNFGAGTVIVATCTEKGYTLYTCQTAGCGYSYKTDVTSAKGHSYVEGTCTRCGLTEPEEPEKPTYVTQFETGVAYKLGFYSTAKGAEYYFSGTMSTQNQYYGASDTAYTNGVDVYVESASGGYHLYFVNSSSQKQYINLVQSGTHYNFTYSSSATSVYTWDADKYTFKTTVGSEVCYIGNYGSYVNFGTLLNSKYKDTDYVARLYTFSEDGDNSGGNNPGGSDNPGGDTPITCQHSYSSVVTKPTCTKEGFTTYTCTLCSYSYVGSKVAASGHNYVNNVCSSCGAAKVADTKATISFADTKNRTEFSTSLQVWAQNGITVTNKKASSNVDVANYSNPARFYAGSDVTIAYPGMTKIEINCAGLASKYISGWMNVPTGATATNNGDVITIVFDKPVDSMTYTKLTAQCRAYDITVYAEAEEDAQCEHINTTVDKAVAPTCTAMGLTEGKHCSDCGEVITEQISVPSLGHDWLDATYDDPKTCDRCGLTEGEKLPAVDSSEEETPGENETSNENDTTDNEPEKDHSQCEAESGFQKLITAIINFLRRLIGLPEQCVCGEEL